MVTLHFGGYRRGVIPDASEPPLRPRTLGSRTLGPRTPRPRTLRADAERNRELIVTAAARLFADRGLSVPLEDVARAAGVGVATLYRRFPTRTDLAVAVFERNLAAYVEVVDAAVANPDAGPAFRTLVEDLCALQASDAGRRAILTTAFPAGSALEQRAADTVEKVRTVIERARAAGAVRPDVGVGDVVVLLLANAGVLEATADHAPGAWRRFAALMLDAFCTGERRELPEATPAEGLRRSIAMLTGKGPTDDRKGAPRG